MRQISASTLTADEQRLTLRATAANRRGILAVFVGNRL